MSATSLTRSSVQVPFLDLKAQYGSIKPEVSAAIDAVLSSAQYVGGEAVDRFEKAFSAYTGARYTVAVSNGTVALELALRATGIGAGDEVIVPTNSFIATAEAVSNVGARPIFADMNAATFHMDAASAEKAITPKTKAIIPVHLYGRAMDLTEIEKLAQKYNLAIIEDAAQAQGIGRKGQRVGGSGRLCCFSFYPGKNLGAYGDAGAITCGTPELMTRLHLLRDHGSPKKYEHSVVGTNARIAGIQAAVLDVKLRHLDAWNAKRVEHAKQYVKRLGGAGVVTPEIPPDGEHNFHLFVVRVRNRDAVLKYLQDHGVGAGIHYPVPIHLTEAYQSLGYPGAGSLPLAEAVSREILSLPMFAELTPEQIDYVCATLVDAVTTSAK
jgi:dTDP-3-amino-3,4,6-trideoxy-alpha-D-glucose transaminase